MQTFYALLCFAVPDSKVHEANMGPTWVLSAPDGPHVGPRNFAIWGGLVLIDFTYILQGYSTGTGTIAWLHTTSHSYACILYFVVFFCGLVPVGFIDIFQSYIKAVGIIIPLP